jgi:hypothetical protein
VIEHVLFRWEFCLSFNHVQILIHRTESKSIKKINAQTNSTLSKSFMFFFYLDAIDEYIQILKYDLQVHLIIFFKCCKINQTIIESDCQSGWITIFAHGWFVENPQFTDAHLKKKSLFVENSKNSQELISQPHESLHRALLRS